VLDLDETLLHSTFNPDDKDMDYDHKIVVESDSKSHDVFVKERPYCREFLAKVSEKWEIVLFTASIASYADECCDIIDSGGLMYWRLFRDSCVSVGSTYSKDMAILGRDQSRALILDNAPVCYLFCPEQGIPIESWYDDPDDRHLLDLLPVLDRILEESDVREGLRKVMPWYQGGVEGCSGPASPGSQLLPDEGREMFLKEKNARRAQELARLAVEKQAEKKALEAVEAKATEGEPARPNAE